MGVAAASREDLFFMIDRLAELERRVRFANPNNGRTHEPQLAIKRAIFGKGGKLKHFWRKGRKAGGTEIMLYPAARICGTQRNKLAMLIYPDSPTIDRVLGQTNRVRQYFPAEWRVDVTWTDKKREVYFPLTESRIMFMGAHQWESMQGFECDLIGFDELADHDPRAYEYCRPNIIPRKGLWIACGAPPLSKHNFYHKIENEAILAPEEWSHHKWNFLDNPFLPEFDWEAEERAHKLRGEEDIWRVQWLADYVYGSSRSVIKAFAAAKHVERLHVIQERLAQSPQKRYFAVYDPGYATCFAVIFVAIDIAHRKISVLREIYETDRNQISARRIWERAQAIFRELGVPEAEWTHLYDSAATGFASEIRDIAGSVTIIPCFKQPNDEEKYFRLINDLCVEGRFEITAECKNTIFEIENYITDENGKYPNAFNHTLDDLRYIVKHCESYLVGRKTFTPTINNNIPASAPRDIVFYEVMAKKQKGLDDWPIF